MISEFEMSFNGELNYFLGLQVLQTSEGTRVHQQKYLRELLKKYGLTDAKPYDTPISPNTKLCADEKGSSVDETMFRGMIGSLLYLTASRPDIRVQRMSLCQIPS